MGFGVGAAVEVAIAGVGGGERLGPSTGGRQSATASGDGAGAGVPLAVVHGDVACGRAAAGSTGCHGVVDGHRLPHHRRLGRVGGDGGRGVGLVHRMRLGIGTAAEVAIPRVAGRQCLDSDAGGRQAATARPCRQRACATVALTVVNGHIPCRRAAARCHGEIHRHRLPHH